jgi:hypothetical protein
MHPKRINTLFFECGQQELTGLPPKGTWLAIKPAFCIKLALAYAQIYTGHLYEPADGLETYNGRLSVMTNVRYMQSNKKKKYLWLDSCKSGKEMKFNQQNHQELFVKTQTALRKVLPSLQHPLSHQSSRE